MIKFNSSYTSTKNGGIASGITPKPVNTDLIIRNDDQIHNQWKIFDSYTKRQKTPKKFWHPKFSR